MPIDSQHSRLFLETTWDFGELPTWFQITPAPGKWKHPTYGEINITDKVLSDFVNNFNSGIYQEHIPIDAEHETKLSGACGYYKDIKVGGPNGEGGLWAQAEWNERGETLLKEERYKYFSPEWYDEWKDPATDKTYYNVLVGGALTTRPFFKDGSLKPLVASEGYMWAIEGDDKWEEMEKVIETKEDIKPKTIKFKVGGTIMDTVLKLTLEQVESIRKGEDIAFSEDQLESIGVKKGTEKVEMAPEVAQAFAEQRAENQKLASELKRATDEVAKMAKETQRREFREFIKTNRCAFQEDVDKEIEKLEKLAEHLPVELFEDLKAEKHSLHERVLASGIFKQESSESGKPTTAKSQIDALADELVKGGMNRPEAMVKVASDHRDLYDRYDKEHKANIRRGGE